MRFPRVVETRKHRRVTERQRGQTWEEALFYQRRIRKQPLVNVRGKRREKTLPTDGISSRPHSPGKTPETFPKIPNQERHLEAAKVDQKVVRVECEPWGHGETQQRKGTELASPQERVQYTWGSSSSILGLKVHEAPVWTEHSPSLQDALVEHQATLTVVAQNQRWSVFFSFNKTTLCPIVNIMLASRELVPGTYWDLQGDKLKGC